jgi:hypothetical protein
MKSLDNMNDDKMKFGDYIWAALLFLLAMLASS